MSVFRIIQPTLNVNSIINSVNEIQLAWKPACIVLTRWRKHATSKKIYGSSETNFTRISHTAVTWPFRSLNLYFSDYFHCGLLKVQYFKRRLHNMNELKYFIHIEIVTILEAVMSKF